MTASTQSHCQIPPSSTSQFHPILKPTVISFLLMPRSHHRHRRDIVGGVIIIGDKSRLFSVVFAAYRDWTKLFLNFLSLTVLTCLQFCSTSDTDKSRCELIIRKPNSDETNSAISDYLQSLSLNILFYLLALF